MVEVGIGIKSYEVLIGGQEILRRRDRWRSGRKDQEESKESREGGSLGSIVVSARRSRKQAKAFLFGRQWQLRRRRVNRSRSEGRRVRGKE